MRRRRGCDASGLSELAFDKASSLPDGELADDVREATERLVCRHGYAEGIEQLDKLWGVAFKASSTAQRWVVQKLKTRAPRKTRRSQPSQRHPCRCVGKGKGQGKGRGQESGPARCAQGAEPLCIRSHGALPLRRRRCSWSLCARLGLSR